MPPLNEADEVDNAIIHFMNWVETTATIETADGTPRELGIVYWVHDPWNGEDISHTLQPFDYELIARRYLDTHRG